MPASDPSVDTIRDYFVPWKPKRHEFVNLNPVAYEVRDNQKQKQMIEVEITRLEAELGRLKLVISFRELASWTFGTLFVRLFVAVVMFALLAGAAVGIAYAFYNEPFVLGIPFGQTFLIFAMTIAVTINLLLLLSSVVKNVYRTLIHI
jgi:hypothetical protein